MKRTLYLLAALIIGSVMLVALSPVQTDAQEVMISYQDFYDQLSPYGQWIYDGEYDNVWVPDVAPGFRPYATDGHWVMTDRGNMWVSDAPWAWACYHYGRWTYNSYYGWVWIPGYEWAPAWVNWRYGGGYYGWAPMGPGHVFGGVYEYPDNYWVFVSPNYLYHPGIYAYYERREPVYYIRQTSYMSYEEHDHYYYGPRREAIERETHQPVQVLRVTGTRESGPAQVGGNEIRVYQPAVNRETERSARPANRVEQTDHPIGRAQPVAPGHESSQPAFRQQRQQQAPGQRFQSQEQGTRPQNQSQPGQMQSQPQTYPQQRPAPGQQQQTQQQRQPLQPQQRQQAPSPAQQHQQRGAQKEKRK